LDKKKQEDMPWLKSERKIYLEEGIYGAVLIDSEFRIFGVLRDSDALLGENISEFFKSLGLSFGEEEKKLLEEAMKYEKEKIIEILGTSEPISLIIMPIKLHDEKLWLLILKRRDITQEELEVIKHNTLANITHELLTPVTIAKASLEAFNPEKEAEEMVSTAMNAILRLENLLRELVRAGPVKAPEQKSEPIQISNVIEIALKHMEKHAACKNIVVETSIEEALPEVEGDRDALVHLMIVLLSNAIKFTPEGRRVIISAKWRESPRSLGRGMIEVCVEDTGIGIPSEEQDKIFDLFYQIDSSPSRRYAGMGLGLYLAKSIVTSHNGEIWVESEPGKGSKFCFTLPTSTGIEKRRL
jgi:signal transduction histidine kinase